jgi:large subunit ribosomal protein L25
MSTNASLNAEKRESRGKGFARRLRAKGRIPAVVYGGDEETLSIHLDAHDTLLLFRSISVENTIVKLNVDGESVAFDTLVREVQAHHIRPEILHVDFLRIQAGVSIEVQVPITIEGVPDGVRLNGGLLELILHDLPIRCLPSQIPEQITVDVTPLDIGDSIHVGDLVLPDGAEVLIEDDQTICAVGLPRAEEEPEEEEEVALDEDGVAIVGEEGATDEEGSED